MQFIMSLLVVVISVSLVSAKPSMNVSASSEGDHVEEGAVWNFGYMSSCATNSYSTRYNGYGCFCGFGGYGTPVDAVDTCCQVHDNCYGDIMAAQGGPCADDTNLYTYTYSYSCTAPWSWLYPSEELVVTCDSEENDACGQALCDCDKVASLCFANNEYNDAYANYDKETNCQA